jgi:hypothetical protein
VGEEAAAVVRKRLDWVATRSTPAAAVAASSWPWAEGVVGSIRALGGSSNRVVEEAEV